LARLVADDLAVLVSDRFGGARSPATPGPTPTPTAAPIRQGERGVANRFIGRTRELAALRKLLADPQTRLVTRVGPGDMGKTRLALQCLATAAPNYWPGWSGIHDDGCVRSTPAEPPPRRTGSAAASSRPSVRNSMPVAAPISGVEAKRWPSVASAGA